MIKNLFIIIFVILPFGQIHAQQDYVVDYILNQLLLNLDLKDDVARLKIYDELINGYKEYKAEQTTKELESKSKWEKSESIDPITDATTIIIKKDDESGSIYNTATIVIRNNTSINQIEFYIHTPEYLNTGDEINVFYRFDKDDPVQTFWNVSTNGSAAFFKETDSNSLEDFINKMKISNFLIIQVYSYSGSKYTYTFNVEGLSEKLDSIERK